MMSRAFRSVGAVVICLALAGGAALGTGVWQNVFNRHYKPRADGVISGAKCALCHKKKNGGGLNSYGKLLKKKKANASSLKAIENRDPDKDGFANIAEIKADTLPGDPNSKPEKK